MRSWKAAILRASCCSSHDSGTGVHDGASHRTENKNMLINGSSRAHLWCMLTRRLARMTFRSFASAPFAATLVGLFARGDAVAQVQPYPPTFRTQRIETNGTTLFVRVGGKGPAVVLLHG